MSKTGSDNVDVPPSDLAGARDWVKAAAFKLKTIAPSKSADPPPVRDEEPFDLGRGAYFDLLERHIQELRLESMTYRRMVDRLIQEGLEPGLTHKDREKAARKRHADYYKDAHRAANAVLRQHGRPLEDEIGSTRWRRLVGQERSDYLILMVWLLGIGAVVAFVAWLLIDLG